MLEDDLSVYIIQELCEGGELVHAIGKVAYSERRVRTQYRICPSDDRIFTNFVC